jgi:hypothetical protein
MMVLAVEKIGEATPAICLLWIGDLIPEIGRPEATCPLPTSRRAYPAVESIDVVLRADNIRPALGFPHTLSGQLPRRPETAVGPPQLICFGCVSICFVKQNTENFLLFLFVSVLRTYIETTETNRTVSKQTERNRNNPKFFLNTKTCFLSNCFGWSSVCSGSIETSKLSVSV